MKMSSMIASMSAKIATEAPAPTAKPAVVQAPAEKTAGATSALDTALAETLRSLPGMSTAKTASAQPETELNKLAAATIAEDRDAEEKHANVIGQAMAHGFLATLDQYGASAGALNKSASADITAEEIALVKLSREDPQAFLEEVARGMNQGGSDKAAEDAMIVDTHNRVVAGIHKLSTDHFMGGYTAMAQVLAE